MLANMYANSSEILFQEPEPEKKVIEKPKLKPRPPAPAPAPPKEDVKEKIFQLKGIKPLLTCFKLPSSQLKWSLQEMHYFWKCTLLDVIMLSELQRRVSAV